MRYGLNASDLESVQKLESVLVGGSEFLNGTLFPTHLEGGRSHESDASAAHDGALDRLTRQNVDLQAELARAQTASRE